MLEIYDNINTKNLHSHLKRLKILLNIYFFVLSSSTYYVVIISFKLMELYLFCTQPYILKTFKYIAIY